VLACYSNEIIGLGVMCSTEKILDAAVAENVDIIGLSGLITASREEMGCVAREMKRRGITTPLLIGGAATSRKHTAVKIAPALDTPIVHVLDASRAVPVVQSLLDDKRRDAFVAENVAEQKRQVELHAGKDNRPLLSIDEARSRRAAIEWKQEDCPMPGFVGRRLLDNISIEELVPYIDWSFFFTAWELKGRYPRILQDEKYGEAARELFQHGQKMLQELIEGGRLHAKAVYGFWAAESQGDDIVLFEDATRAKEVVRFCMLREQKTRGAKDHCLCLADFIAPAGSGIVDHIGAFAVTAGIGAEEIAVEFENQNDDYSAIMVKALADRLAEALAEYLHARARREWGYELEAPSNEELIAEKFRGIRPAFGYPACPDHRPKRDLFDLLNASEAGMALTESCAMTPAAAVSGLYFAHPQARYFNVGRLARDQMEDYSERMGQNLEESEKWLQSNLGYNS